MPHREACVIVQAPSATTSSDVAARLPGRFKVLSALPPRVFIVRIEVPEDVSELRALGAAEVLTSEPHALNLSPPLNESEQLFVEGWFARGTKSGPRAGDGRDWDATGFTPPDAPRP